VPQVTALQIAALKRVSGGSRIVLMDKNGGQAQTIAKELARRGFGKVRGHAAADAARPPARPTDRPTDRPTVPVARPAVTLARCC
jgi:hypothetical protein